MPWRTSDIVRTVVRLRRQGEWNPLAAQEVRAEAAAKILPALSSVRLHPDACKLLHAYFGVGPKYSERPTLPRAQELARLPCLNRPNHHMRLCEKIIWALCDPGAREWVAPTFYSGTWTG
jgi:hypothetical protein